MAKRGWNRHAGAGKAAAVMLAVLLAAVTALAFPVMPAAAYFDRGPVTPALGQSSVQVTVGSSVSVSCALSPASDRQLPGCGMAECPQICGEKDCLDENGQCTCGGTTYQTYYAEAAVASSNTSVASASYSSGSIVIHGVSAGSATVTVTASLRQHTSQSRSINVTVTAPQQQKQSSSGSGSSSSGKKKKSSAGSAGSTAVKVAGAGASSGTQASGESASAVGDSGQEETSEKASDKAARKAGKKEKHTKTVKEKDGDTIIIEDIVDAPQGKDIFKKIMGTDKRAQFRKLDEAGSVLYSWTFKGEDIRQAVDMNMNITTAAASDKKLAGLAKGINVLSLKPVWTDDFAGKAVVYIPVPSSFTKSEGLCLYRRDGDELKLLYNALSADNGYVSMPLEEGGSYVLAEEEIPAAGEANAVLITAVAAVIAEAAIAAIFVLHRRKKL